MHRPRGVGCRRPHGCRPPPAASAALLHPSAAGEAAKTTLLERLKVVPDRGIFGLPVCEVERPLVLVCTSLLPPLAAPS